MFIKTLFPYCFLLPCCLFAGIGCSGQTQDAPLPILLQGHRDSVSSIAFSPDSKILASGSDDRTIRLWDVDKWTTSRTLKGNGRNITSVGFSFDGKRIFGGTTTDEGFLGMVIEWEVSSGRELQKLPGHTRRVNCLAVSPDNKTLATGSIDCTIKLRDLTTGDVQFTLDGHTDVVDALAFSPDGEIVLSASRDRTLRLWAAKNGKSIAILRGHVGRIYSVAFTPDGKTVVSGADKGGSKGPGEIKLWDVSQASELATLKGHSNFVFAVAVSPSGRKLASASNISGSGNESRHEIKIWDLESRRELQSVIWKGSDSSLTTCLAYSPDGKYLALGDWDGTIKVWKLEDEAFPNSGKE